MGVLSEFSSETEISLEALSGLAASALEAEPRNILGSLDDDLSDMVASNMGGHLVSQEDTYYDGHFVRVEQFMPTMAEHCSITLDILGPFWDRIFRCEFTGVIEITSAESSPFLTFAEIHHMEVTQGSDQVKVCTFKSWREGQFLSIRYMKGRVRRMILRTPLERKMPSGH